MPRDEPTNAGKPWTDAEEQRLLVMFSAGYTLQAMCAELGRTPYAVLTRLVRQGRLVVRDGLYHRIDPVAFSSFAEAKEVNRLMGWKEVAHYG